MDIIKIGVKKTNTDLQKLVKYGLDIILSNNNKCNISLFDIDDNNNVTNCDWIAISVKYDNNEQNLNLQIDDCIGMFPGFSNFFVIVEHGEQFDGEKLDKEFEVNYKTDLNINIKFINICLGRALEYLSVIRDDIATVEMKTIDKILLDELGKQKFKQLNSNEKKIKEIKNLVRDEKIVEEWIETFGFDKLLDLFEVNLIGLYEYTICKHCLMIVDYIMGNFEEPSKSTNFQLEHLSNLISNLLDANKIFYNHNTNLNFNQVTKLEIENKLSNELLTTYEQNHIIKNINSHIINTSAKYDIIKEFGYDFLEKYLDLIKKYVSTFGINNEQITLVISELTKNKIMFKFNEELFNELSSLDKTINPEENKNNLFLECIDVWIKNDLNNFCDLVKYSKKNNQPNQTQSVISIFILHTEFLIENENTYNLANVNLDTSRLIEAFQIILNSNDLKENISVYNTIQISKLMYIITYFIFNENNIVDKHKLLKQTGYIFDKYICDYINYNDEKYNLFIHNVYLNYSNIVNKTKLSGGLIEFYEFEKTHNVFKQLLKILFEFVGYNQVFKENITQNIVNTDLISNNKQNSENDNNSDNDSDSDESDTNKSNSDDESIIKNLDSDMSESDEELYYNKQIEKIYGFIKKTMNGKHLNQQTLKKVSEIYWKKNKDYNKSIKSFESDMINKKFTKIYKENNNSK